jgi:chromosome segregation protein
MRLKRVRIFGFKTFADRTEFNLDGGIIAVVGPNGCGKSNLVDAILWGLGEGNARHLRAASNQDVIFSGSSRRKPVGYAEVSLLFDNEDGGLPIDTPEVSITRRLNRAGESEYAINRQTCRQRDIYDLLADSGLGRSGYAIVGQKEIDQALAASAEDRRAWIDEAAGVQRYRSRKTESLRRLTSAHQHLERVSDILRELDSQREPLRGEAEVAARYKSALSSLREVESGLLINEVAKAVREVEELEKRIEDSARLARQENERAEKLDAEIRRAGERISELEREMDTARGLQQGSLTAIERAEANLKLGEQRLISLKELEQSLGEERENAAERLRELSAEIEVLTQEELNERNALDRLRAEFAGAGGEAKALTEELKEVERQLAQARDRHAQHLRAQAEAAHRTERRKQAEREIKGIDATLPDLQKAVADAQSEYDAQAAGLAELSESIKRLEAALVESRRDEERDAQEIRRHLAEKAALEGRRRGIEATIETHEGLNQGARAVLEARDRGVFEGEFTPVGEAVETDKEYALAIETALGGASNDLIVDHESDAKTAIAWLKQHRQGRATFQPIPLMRPVEPSHELRRVLGERGVIGRASELLTCRSKHRPVVDSLLGRVVIVEDIDTALRLAKTSGWSRMVTLEGEIVHSSGAVTGGHSAKQGYGLVQRRADLSGLVKQIDDHERLVADAEKRASKRGQQRDKLRAEQEALRATHAERQSEAEEARSFLHTLKEELSSGEKSRQRLQNEVEKLVQSQGEVPADVDIPAIDERRDALLRQVAARTADAEGAEARLRDAEHRVQQAQLRLYTAQKRFEATRDAEQTREKRIGHLEPDRQRALAEIEASKKDRELAEKEKAKADARLETLLQSKRELLEQSFQLSEDAKAARNNAISVGDAVHQAELNRARADARRASSLQRLYEEYGLTEEDALEQEGTHEIPPDAPMLVNRLRRELKAMGDVNLGAIEAYERLTLRFEELNAQHEDIVLGIEQIHDSIKELDKLTRERFVTTFAKVQEAFAETFEKLFGGGEGKILLSDPSSVLESGVDIEVTLPGKKRQRLELLSGGERALCASSFLFALLKVKPSPLVVLDEVDAPLDGRNVERFAALLHEYTDTIQFIIITHNPTTIEQAPVWLGVTMQEPGVSTLVPARVDSREARAVVSAG